MTENSVALECEPAVGSGLEQHLQTQLNRPASAGTNDRVGGGDIWGGTASAKTTCRRIIQSKSVLSTVRIGEIGMVEEVEELGAELHPGSLSEMPILCHREIQVAETGIRKDVSAHRPELAERRWKHYRGFHDVTAPGR